MNASLTVIANPAARRASKKKIDRAVSLLKAEGFEVNVLFTEKGGDAEVYARQLVSENPHFVLAAGGDGTFNEVINGLAGTDVPMAILPLGTTNVLAKELSIPEDVEEAINRALRGKPQKVSLGKITFSQGVRYFCLMAGIGYDGQTVNNVNKRIKKYSGKGAYILSGVKTLLSWKPELLTIDIDGKRYHGYSLIVSNSSKYAGNFRVAPDASLKEPLLHVFLMHGNKRLDIVKYTLGILSGRHLKLKNITYIKAKDIEVKGTAHVQVDGDYLGKTPASLTVVPDAVKLIY
jgi:YegS/Rv2252/BmrU family lipid kinase